MNKVGLKDLMIDVVPISNKKSEISRRLRKWDRNFGPTEDFDGTKGTSSLVESKRREVEESSNLVLDLKFVGEVLARSDRACGSMNSILIRISSLLNTIPVQIKINAA